jgi:hypothetical protein
MTLARRYSESEDSLLIGSILPVVAAFLGRNVWFPFDGRKYANIYSLLVAKPGMRKAQTSGSRKRPQRNSWVTSAF